MPGSLSCRHNGGSVCASKWQLLLRCLAQVARRQLQRQSRCFVSIPELQPLPSFCIACGSDQGPRRFLL